MCKKDIMHAAPRILIGLFFLIAGIMKLLIPGSEGFADMVNGSFGISGSFGLLLAWLVVIAKIGGGAVLMAGKMVPTKLYKFSIRILVIISVTAAVFVHLIPAISLDGEAFITQINSMFKALIIAAVLVHICHSKTVCPMEITGEKTHKH